MAKANKPETEAAWQLATWDGARREALRRWAELPLECVIAALEEMQELSDALAGTISWQQQAPRPKPDQSVPDSTQEDGFDPAKHRSDPHPHRSNS